MEYRLLVDLEAVAVLDSASRKVRMRLLDHLVQLRSSPQSHSDYQEYDGSGRQLEISVFAGYALHYWIDFADRHVKILAIKPADA